MKKNHSTAQQGVSMPTLLSRLGMTLIASFACASLQAASLQGLDVAALPGDKVELKLTFDEPVNTPRGYTIEQPARIALDLPGVQNGLGVKNRELGVGNARSVTVVEAGDRTRVIINLTNLAPYNTRSEGNQLYVVVGEEARPGFTSPTPLALEQPRSRAVQAQEVKNIDFQRGAQGEGNVVIDLSDSSVTPDIREQGNKIVVSLPRTALPEPLRVRLDVKDFATPVQFRSVQFSPRRGTPCPARNALQVSQMA